MKGVCKNIVLRHFLWIENIGREIVELQMVHLYKGKYVLY